MAFFNFNNDVLFVLGFKEHQSEKIRDKTLVEFVF